MAIPPQFIKNTKKKKGDKESAKEDKAANEEKDPKVNPFAKKKGKK